MVFSDKNGRTPAYCLRVCEPIVLCCAANAFPRF
uniref:Uncharacterized protein n=1 Tax=Anopheles dirus TaxID=7168 RepID=A0A182NX34_9DIPT